MKLKNKVMVLWVLNIIYLFSIQNPDFILNKEKFKKNLIMEVRKINLDNTGERRRIYFYDNGDVEDIFFNGVEYVFDNVVSVEVYKIKNKKILNFINNFSLEAIDSVKNDEIIYKQNYKNDMLYFSENNKIRLSYAKEFYLAGKNEGDLLFNGKKKVINYRKEYNNIKNEKIITVKNAPSLYEIRYKNKIFMIIDEKNEYKNKEIKLLIDLISFPFLNSTDFEKKLVFPKEKEIFSDLQIEEIKFIDSFHYIYHLYTMIDDNKIEKISLIPKFINQLEIKKEILFLKDNKTKKEILKYFDKKNNNNIEYSYEVKSLRNIVTEKETIGKNNQNIEVKYNNKIFKNPKITKIYSKTINPIIIINNDNIINKIELNVLTKKIIPNKKINLSYNETELKEKNIENFESIREIDKVLAKKEDLKYYIDSSKNPDYLLINDYLFYTENLEKFTSNLKKNWNYKGLTPSEFKKEHSIESLEKLNKIMQEINKK